MPDASTMTLGALALDTAVVARRQTPPVVDESRRPAKTNLNAPSRGPSERNTIDLSIEDAMGEVRCGGRRVLIMRALRRWSTRRSCPRRETLLRRAHRQAEQRRQHERDGEGDERRLITSRDVVNETKKRRARGAERVGYENAQAAHCAER